MFIETAVHGVNTVAEYVGPGKLVNVSGVPWSDIVGLRKGWGTTFRGVARSYNWFHLAVPSIIATSATSNASGTLMSLVSIIINFQTFGSAKVNNVHVWLGAQRVFVRDNINLAGDFRDRIVLDQNIFLINHTLEPGMTVGVSIGVDFGSSDSDILFQGAGGTFGG